MSKTVKEVEDYILKGIISGEFKPGFRVPSAMVIGEKFGCPEHHVANTYRELQSRGYLFTNKKDRSKGTFVSQSLGAKHIVNSDAKNIEDKESKKKAEKLIKAEQFGFSVEPIASGGWKFQFGTL